MNQNYQSELTLGGSRLLMAEDNQINQKLASMIFKRVGHDLTIVSNGREAVDAAASGDYAVIFMDVQMPLMDGIEATRHIKSEMGENAPLIIALTANAMPGDEERFLDAGMDHYLSKPIDMIKLKDLLTRLIPS